MAHGRLRNRMAGSAWALECLEERRLLDASGDVVEIAAPAQETPPPLGAPDPNGDFELFGTEQALADHLLKRAEQQWAWALGQTLDYPPQGGGWWWRYGPEVDWLDAAPSAGGGDRSHSDTNVQVGGVDEADIMETDGDYLYLISGQELLIFDAFPADETNIVSRTLIASGENGQTPIGMFLRGDRLTVVTTEYGYYPYYDVRFGGPMVDFGFAPWPYPGGTSSTSVTVYDVSDRTDPTIVDAFKVDGNYVTSRSTDGVVQLIVNNSFNFPVPEYQVVDAETGELVTDPELEGEAPWQYYPYGKYKFVVESAAAYHERLADSIVDEVMPHLQEGLGDDAQTSLLSSPDSIYTPTGADDWSLSSIVLIDTAAEDPTVVGSTSLFSDYNGVIYVSHDAIYTAAARWVDLDASSDEEWGYRTEIKKFALTDTGAELAAIGTVRGQVLNQFSLDEYDGNLRVATTENWGREARNHVFVLAEDGAKLNVVGSVEDLAPGERIFSARFFGEQAFVVTFRQVDPLFTIDLSDPASPQVEAELKLPGFSTYLQPLGEGRLLGIGRDADPETGRQEEVQVTVFDVDDLANPTVHSQFSFDEADWGWSEAEYNHLAVGWYPEYDTLAIPLAGHSRQVGVDADGDGRDDWYRWEYFSNLQVLDVDLAEGGDIEQRGVVEQDSTVRRSVRIDDYLYSISDESLKVVPINDPSSAVAEVMYNRDFVGVQNDPSGAGDRLLVIGTHDDDKVEIVPGPDAVLRVIVNGQARGDFNADAIASIEANGLSGPNSVILHGSGPAKQLGVTSVAVTRRPDLGDFDGDGEVGLSDFILLKQSMGQTGDDLLADANGDGAVDLNDFSVLREHFGAKTIDFTLVDSTEGSGVGPIYLGVPEAAFAVAADAALAEDDA